VRGWDKFLEAEFLYERRHVEPPAQLYFLGRDWQILNSAISVSFGGTVSPVADGVQMATMLAQATVDNTLGLDALVVGGGVLGVDTAAHLGALDKAGKTVAVLANAVRHGLHPYRPRRSFLQSAILNHQGGLVAEHDDRVDDYRVRLLDRDRIITALSDVFVAIECSGRSATVDAAKRAKLQGKRVIAVDWSRLARKWAEPKTAGNRELMTERINGELIAEPFPVDVTGDSAGSWWWEHTATLSDQWHDVLRHTVEGQAS